MTRLLLVLTVVVPALPELVRLVNDERARRHEAKQKALDREKDIAVATISAGAQERVARIQKEAVPRGGHEA